MIVDQKFLDFFKDIVEENGRENTRLSKKSLEEFFELLEDVRDEANKTNNEYLKFEISASYLVCKTHLTLIFGLIFDEGFCLFPNDYLGENYKPNPNTFLQSAFSLIMNHSLAIIRLVHDGLEYPARVLLRSLHETCELIPVLLANKNLLKTYLDAKNPKEEYSIWRKYFTHSKLNDELSKVEEKLFGIEDLTYIKKYRDNINNHYSSFVHTSTLASLIGGHVKSIEKDEYLESNLLGRASETGKLTLYRLCYTNFYTLFLLIAIVKENDDLIFPEENFWFKDFQDLFSVLHESVNHMSKKY